MKGKERGGKKESKRDRQTERLGGMVEKEGGLRGTAHSVQLKNKTKKKLDEINDVSNV